MKDVHIVNFYNGNVPAITDFKDGTIPEYSPRELRGLIRARTGHSTFQQEGTEAYAILLPPEMMHGLKSAGIGFVYDTEGRNRTKIFSLPFLVTRFTQTPKNISETVHKIIEGKFMDFYYNSSGVYGPLDTIVEFSREEMLPEAMQELSQQYTIHRHALEAPQRINITEKDKERARKVLERVGECEDHFRRNPFSEANSIQYVLY